MPPDLAQRLTTGRIHAWHGNVVPAARFTQLMSRIVFCRHSCEIAVCRIRITTKFARHVAAMAVGERPAEQLAIT